MLNSSKFSRHIFLTFLFYCKFQLFIDRNVFSAVYMCGGMDIYRHLSIKIKSFQAYLCYYYTLKNQTKANARHRKLQAT